MWHCSTRIVDRTLLSVMLRFDSLFLKMKVLRSFETSVGIFIYIQQNAMLHSLFYLETVLRVSGSSSTYHQERIQLYLQYLVFVTPLLLPAALVEELER
jgi:hypothetical protein